MGTITGKRYVMLSDVPWQLHQLGTMSSSFIEPSSCHTGRASKNHHGTGSVCQVCVTVLICVVNQNPSIVILMSMKVSLEQKVYRSSVANSLAPLSLHITPIISCRRRLPVEETRLMFSIAVAPNTFPQGPKGPTFYYYYSILWIFLGYI